MGQGLEFRISRVLTRALLACAPRAVRFSHPPRFPRHTGHTGKQLWDRVHRRTMAAFGPDRLWPRKKETAKEKDEEEKKKEKLRKIKRMICSRFRV